jgi:hypothetical protein
MGFNDGRCSLALGLVANGVDSANDGNGRVTVTFTPGDDTPCLAERG